MLILLVLAMGFQNPDIKRLPNCRTFVAMARTRDEMEKMHI
jgi:hypothetical protein